MYFYAHSNKAIDIYKKKKNTITKQHRNNPIEFYGVIGRYVYKIRVKGEVQRIVLTL